VPVPRASYVGNRRIGGRSVSPEARRDAMVLLRAMKERHDQHNPEEPLSEGTRLAPELVAERVGLEPGTLRYERALRYLVSEGALVWEQRLGGAPGVDFYVITRRGLEML
jgi:hypothetical protein